MKDNIKVDYLHNHPNYKVVQHQDMYHFNTDTCLLGEFIKINENDRVLDVGTNNGALLVYIINKKGLATGIDINPMALEIASLTLKENNFNATLINADFSLYVSQDLYDVIVCNPPYFKTKEEKNKNLNYHIKIARHEETLSLKNLCKSFKCNLKASGKIYMVYRLDRFLELKNELQNNDLYINYYQIVYDKKDNLAKSVLLEISFKKIKEEKLEDMFI